MMVQYPVMVSPKLDGIRVLIRDGVPVTRTLKTVRSLQVRNALQGIEYALDGEVMAVSGSFQNSTTAVMKEDADNDWRYFVFDLVDDTLPFHDRYRRLVQLFDRGALPDCCVLVEHEHVWDGEQLEDIHKQHISEGHEGTMLRGPQGKYKHGRSTINEGILLKLKQFTDDEAVIVGFEELQHNANAAVTNVLGLTERGHSKANKVASGVLGAFVVELLKDRSIQFKIGTGLTEQQRIDYWQQQEELLGKLVKFKHFDFGVKTAPRHPVFIGFRDKDDL